MKRIKSFKMFESLNGERSYSEKATVKGIEISVDFDKKDNEYKIYFPQLGKDVSVFKTALDMDVPEVQHDQDYIEAAKEYFEFAKQKAAQGNKTPDDVYQELSDFWDYKQAKSVS